MKLGLGISAWPRQKQLGQTLVTFEPLHLARGLYP